MKSAAHTPLHALRAATVLLIACCLCACPQQKREHNPRRSAAATVSPALDSLAKALKGYSFAGRHDSVILVAGPALRAATLRHDTLTMVYAGLNMAQSFLFMGNMDSVQHYLDRIEPLKEYPLSANLHIMRSNVLGSYDLRSNLDYSKALNHYIDGLFWADSLRNRNNRIALLSNIVNIFYLQGSGEGLEYAREAYELAMSQPQTSLYSKCAACIVMAQMYYVKQQYDTATHYLSMADMYAEKGNALSQMSYIYAMSAWISQHGDDTARAARFYARAIDFIRYTDPGTAQQIYLTYGDFLVDRGDRSAAAAMYRKGLDISDTSGNIEYRTSLLGHMADLAYETGDYPASARLARMYKSYSDSISDRREREFRELIDQREEAELQREVLTRELEQQKSEQRFLTLLFIFFAVTGFSFLLGLLYYRQRKMYGKLVKKHQEYLTRLELKSNCDNSDHNDSDRRLFARIEHLMRDERIYRMKTLTLEMLAEMTGSNRTYCSRAINTFAGMSFNRYLDTFRIAEATRTISERSDSILFKQLADDIGYNSVTVFSKAFQRETGCTPSIYRKEVRGYRTAESSDNL